MNRVITSRRSQVLAAVLTLCLPAVAGAAPRGVATSPGELSRPARARLVRLVQREQRARPKAFAAVARLRAMLPALERRKRARGRLLSVARPLRALGRAGYGPMLRELAVRAAPRGAMPERAWRGWRVSLLEALGSLRDARSAPVLEAILKGKDRDPALLRAAAVALGRLGSDSAARTLIRLARAPDADLAVLVPALGQCRRLVAARALAAMLRKAGKRPSRDALVVAALGQVGNAWAWQTPAVTRSGEGEATRKLASEALVSAYPALDAATQKKAVKALKLVGHPSARHFTGK